MQSDTAARLRRAGIGIGAVAAPVAGAIAAGSIAQAAVPATAEAPAPAPAPGSASQPLVAKFKRKNVLYGRRVPVRGALLTGQGGRRILLQVNKGRGWHTVARARTGPHGRFYASFRPHGLGRYRMRVRLVGPVAANALFGASSQTRGKLTVYRQTLASWYGPGFIGGRPPGGAPPGARPPGGANKKPPWGAPPALPYPRRTGK